MAQKSVLFENMLGVDAGHIAFLPVKGDDPQAEFGKFNIFQNNHWKPLDSSKIFDMNGLYGCFRTSGRYRISVRYASHQETGFGTRVAAIRAVHERSSASSLPCPIAIVDWDGIVVLSDSCYVIDTGTFNTETHKIEGGNRKEYERVCGLNHHEEYPPSTNGMSARYRQVWTTELDNGLTSLACNSGFGDGSYGVTASFHEGYGKIASRERLANQIERTERIHANSDKEMREELDLPEELKKR